MTLGKATASHQTDSLPSIPVALWLLLALFGVGLASLIYGLNSDTSRPDFALFTVSLLFLMGVSQAGVVFCAITRLVRAQWAKPYYRLAELSTLAFSPFALLGLLLIVSYGREELFYWLNPAEDLHLSPWLDSHWLLIRNLVGLLLFYGLSGFYVSKGLKPDLAQSTTLVQPATEATPPDDHRRRERELYRLSPLVILAFVFCNTLLAWDFAMMLIPHWHSTVFPIYFWFGNLFAGCAALIAFPAILGAARASDSIWQPVHITSLGMLITSFTLMWLYFFWSQFFVIWFGNLPHESDPLWRQMYGHYAPYYWTMMAGCFFVPFVGFIFAFVKRSILAMCLIGAGINLGIWLNKYLMVMPVFSPDNRPFTNWLDICLSVGLLAGFLVVVMLLARYFPTYAYWEINLKPEVRP